MGSNLTNKQINTEYNQNRPFKRVGSCKDCNGRCCNYVIFGSNYSGGNRAGNADYFEFHGIKIVDKWDGNVYTVISARCSQFTNGCKCKLFDQKEMPECCQQFPVNPFDTVWRYLKQIGTPCGFNFVDRKTGKPWNMRRREKK